MSRNAFFAAPFAALATLGLMAAAAPAPAIAAEKTVRYDDLNLASAAGQKELERRLTSAAREVCDMNKSTTGTRLRSSEATACYEQAKDQARTQMAAIMQSRQIAVAR